LRTTSSSKVNRIDSRQTKTKMINGSTRIVGYISSAKMLLFVIFFCDFFLHVAAAACFE